MSAYEWHREQLAAADLDDETRADVLSLITLWERMSFVADDPRREKVLSTFGDLARGVAIDVVDDPSFAWAPATKAKPRQHDKVRVRRDAFPGDVGRQLNGREGIIARISRGSLVVAFKDGSSTHVQPEKLETQVPL